MCILDEMLEPEGGGFSGEQGVGGRLGAAEGKEEEVLVIYMGAS